MKSWYRSKTIWFNALTVLVTIATMYGYVPDQGLANKATMSLLAVAPIINVILRVITSTRIGRRQNNTN